MLKKIRSIIFFWIFGINYQGLLTVYKNQLKLEKMMKSHLEKTHSALEDIQIQVVTLEDMVIECINMTGGSGWTHTIQQAVMHLDLRLDELREAVIQHESNFEAIAEENQEIVNAATSVPLKQLN